MYWYEPSEPPRGVYHQLQGLTPSCGRCACCVCACVRAGQDRRAVLQARMHADGASAAADEALRLLLDAGYRDGNALLGGMRAMLAAAAQVAVVSVSGNDRGHAAAAASSSCGTPGAAWCGVVSTAIKLARRVTRRLRRPLQAAAPASRQQRYLHEPPGGGATREARVGAAVDEQSSMLLAQLLGLAASAATTLSTSAGAFFIQARCLASHVSPARLHLGASHGLRLP